MRQTIDRRNSSLHPQPLKQENRREGRRGGKTEPRRKSRPGVALISTAQLSLGPSVFINTKHRPDLTGHPSISGQSHTRSDPAQDVPRQAQLMPTIKNLNLLRTLHNQQAFRLTGCKVQNTNCLTNQMYSVRPSPLPCSCRKPWRQIKLLGTAFHGT